MTPESDNEHLHRYLLALTRSLPQLVWTSHDHGEWTWASPRWEAYTGQNAEESQGTHWLAAVHPDDREAVAEAWRQADRSGVLDVEHRLLSHPGEARWFRTRATPLPDIPAQERVWLGTCTDVHDTRLRQEHAQAAEAASQRQVSDTLALIRSVARRAFKVDTSAEASAAHLDSRLEAITRIQHLLRNRDARVEVAELVSDGLLAHAAHEGERIRIDGPPLFLDGFTAELFGLAVHELAMNAVEHGALSSPRSRIDITWRVQDDVFRFEWAEADVSAPGAGRRRKGFGTELIETTLRLRLGAMTALAFEPRGVRCLIAMPTGDGVTPGGPDLPG